MPVLVGTLVIVHAPNGESVEGRTVTHFNDDCDFGEEPFTLLCDDGERILVKQPWDCELEFPESEPRSDLHATEGPSTTK